MSDSSLQALLFGSTYHQILGKEKIAVNIKMDAW